MVIPSNDEKTLLWLPGKCKKGKPKSKGNTDNNDPIAMFPYHNNPRIVAQRGVFTIHGARAVALNNIHDLKMARIIINYDKREHIRKELRYLGVDNTALFPELENVVRDIEDRTKDYTSSS